MKEMRRCRAASTSGAWALSLALLSALCSTCLGGGHGELAAAYAAGLRECGKGAAGTDGVPALAAVTCVGGRGTGKSTLLEALFSNSSGPGGFSGRILEEEGLAVVEVDAGSDQQAAAAASADVVLYNVLWQDVVRSPRAAAEILRPSLELAARLDQEKPVYKLRVLVRDCPDDEAKLASLLSLLREEVERVIKDAEAGDVDVSFHTLPHSSFRGAGFSSAVEKLRSAISEVEPSSPRDLSQRLKSAMSLGRKVASNVEVRAASTVYLASRASEKCLQSFGALLGKINIPDPDFGLRVDSIVDEVLREFDDAASSSISGSSSAVGRIRDELASVMLIELGKVHAAQVEFAKAQALDNFREKVASIRSVGGVTKDLDDAVAEADKAFVEAVSILGSKRASWPSSKARSELLREMREIASERQQIALLSKGLGAAKPRKAISVGMHTFVEQAFAKDSRVEGPTLESGRPGWTPYTGKADAEQLLFDINPPDQAIADSRGQKVNSQFLERAKRRMERAKKIVVERQVDGRKE